MTPESAEPTALALWGASGRMGTEILKLAASGEGRFRAVQAVVSARSPRAGQRASEASSYTAPGPLLPEVEVVVDFSSPAALAELLGHARSARKPVVSGTTGLEEHHKSLLQEASVEIPVFWAPNFSVGVAALIRAVEAVLPLLEESDIEIVEGHHSAKKDAPSGTANKILEAIQRTRARPPAAVVHGRKGLSPRAKGEIGVHALRGGSNPGRHEVHLLGASEDVVLCHQVYGREAFARGALRAARFVCSAAPGLYGMDALLPAR